jgi:hypothetical protein
MKRQGFFGRVDDLAGIFKAPADVVDYSLDWVDHLASGVTIADATWTVPAGLAAGSQGVTGTVATKRLSAGTAGAEYTVTCTITKSSGEVLARSFVITVVAELS